MKNYFFFFRSRARRERAVEMKDNTIAAITAWNGPSISTPGTIYAAIPNTIALTTNMNNPRVIKVSGAVKRTSSGLINVLRNPNMIANNIAVTKSLISNPGTNLSVKNKANEFKRSAITNCIY